MPTKKRHDRLRLHRIGDVPVMVHRPVEGRIKTCTIVKDADRWFAVLTTEDGPAPEPRGEVEKPVGIDLGLNAFATLSVGAQVRNPRHLREAERGLTRRQRRLARTEKGSRNRERARRKVAKAHQKVREARRDFCHQVSRWLVDEYDLIVFEDLSVKDLVRNRHLSKSISDAGWALLVGMTDAKAERAGRRVVLVEPKGTSRDCSECGMAVPKPLSERTHRCRSCGLVMDRDWNAARNVLWRGLSPPGAEAGGASGGVPSRVGRELAELRPVEERAATRSQGATGQAAPVKQEGDLESPSQDAPPFTGG